jgi:hypothetical protein
MRSAARTACAAALSCATAVGVVLRGGLRVTVGRVHHASHTKRESQSQKFYAFHVSLLILEKVVGFASEPFANVRHTSTRFLNPKDTTPQVGTSLIRYRKIAG